jgi:outer membrane protein TolC
MLMTKICKIFTLVLALIPAALSAQEARLLTFEEAAAIAVRNSFSVQDTELDLRIKHYGFIANRAGLRSRVDLALIAPEIKNELEEQFDQETQLFNNFNVNTLSYVSRLSITQPLPSNGKIAANINLDRFKQSGDAQEYTTNMFLSFSQPIFVPNQLQRNIYRAELDLDKAKIEYLQRRVSLIYGRSFFRLSDIENYFRGGGGRNNNRESRRGGGGNRGGGGHRGGGESLSQNYYQLYEQTKMLEFDSRFFSVWEDLKNISQQQLDNGTLSERENLQISVEFANSENVLFSSTARKDRSTRSLNQFLGLEVDENIRVINTIDYNPVVVVEEKALSEGIANNTGIRGFSIDIFKDRLRIDEVAADGRITGEVSGSYGLNNSDQSIRLHFDEFSQSRSLKLGLRVPVWDWGRNDLFLEASKNNLEVKKRQRQNDIYDTQRQITGHIFTINLMQERIDLLTRAKDLAEQGMLIARQQFIEGDISSEDLILSVKKNYQAQVEFLQLLVDHKVALIQLANQTQWDFEKNVSIRAELEAIIASIIDIN